MLDVVLHGRAFVEFCIVSVVFINMQVVISSILMTVVEVIPLEVVSTLLDVLVIITVVVLGWVHVTVSHGPLVLSEVGLVQGSG